VDLALDKQKYKRKVRLTVPHYVALGDVLQHANLIAMVPERFAQRIVKPFELVVRDLPVKVEDVTTHKMHAEWGEVTSEAAAEITATKQAGGRVIPVGTTALRLIETAARTTGQVQAWLNDVEDDATWREAMVQEIREGEHSYTAEETELISKGVAMLGTFATGKGKARPMRRSKTVELAATKHDKISGLLIGHVEAELRTSPEQAIAYLMHFDSKFFRSTLNPAVEVRREVLEVKSPHHSVVFLEKKSAPLHNRTWLLALLWQKVSDTPLTYMWVCVPSEHHSKISPDKEYLLVVLQYPKLSE
jgi:hypothetical protein